MCILTYMVVKMLGWQLCCETTSVIEREAKQNTHNIAKQHSAKTQK